MREALKEARRAEAEGEIPIGAVVVCEGRIIARAHNQTETLHDPTAHAEMLAMTAATSYIGGKYLPECTLRHSRAVSDAPPPWPGLRSGQWSTVRTTPSAVTPFFPRPCCIRGQRSAAEYWRTSAVLS